jgi:radical SAM protein with 4Fe4S-binding SPASM domain
VPKVNINWFQQSIDTEERNWKFNSHQGNMVKYLYNRYQWFNYPRLSRLNDFPLHLDIEVSAKCNMACPMCPRRHTDISKYDHMKFDLFQKIVDECAEHNLFSARLSWRGESLTHPDFLKFVHYIKKVRKIPNVSFLTNGHHLTEEIAQGLVDMKVDYVSFSVDGTGDIYEAIRTPAKFETVYKGIKTLKEIRDRAGKKRPQIRVNGLWPAIAQDREAYFGIMGEVADKIVSNPIKNYNVNETTEFDSDYICQFLWERLFVGFDGRTQPCSNSIETLYIGDAKKQTISEIWRGEVMEELREAHLQGKLDKYFACSRCSYRVKEDFKSQLDQDWTDWDPRIYSPKDKAGNENKSGGLV